MRRFEFRDDRLRFSEWVKASSSAHHVTYSHYPLGLFIRVSKWIGGKEWHIEQVISQIELETVRFGWRWLVAQCLKRMRHKMQYDAWSHNK